MVDKNDDNVAKQLEKLLQKQVSPLDLLPHKDLREKFIDLVLNGEPHHHDQEITRLFSNLENALGSVQIDQTKVVVFGGGTGLSNIIGGDCRSEGWARAPFFGLKEIFPQTKSVVCVTDDGGSTGEMLKDLPLVAIGDIRHVLLSSIQLAELQRIYQVSVARARLIASELAKVFNYRFTSKPESSESLILQSTTDLGQLPRGLAEMLVSLVNSIFSDERLSCTLQRPHCLGNLIVAAAIYKYLQPEISNEDVIDDPQLLHDPIFSGMQYLSLNLGCGIRSVLPCTTTPSQLRVVYTNGVQTTGESKSSSARRGVPVDSAHVDFCGEPLVYPDIIRDIEEADILIMAPGSLYSSIIPVFKVPGLADAVRRNTQALKLLVSNLWVQAGETDLSLSDPQRKFRVSDMIRAYERNIPGGTRGLFNEVLCLSLKDVPASVIQSYAVEGKIPIYLDREVVREQGYIPVECGIYSKHALAERGVIQHDPSMLATAVKVLYIGSSCFGASVHRDRSGEEQKQPWNDPKHRSRQFNMLPNEKYHAITDKLSGLSIDCSLGCGCNCYSGLEHIRERVSEIIWKHHDIPLSHLDYITGIRCVDVTNWHRDQQWDNVYSFYDPDDGLIKIRKDQFAEKGKLEVALLIAIGESLLGNYALKKSVADVVQDNIPLGKVYHLYLRSEGERNCFFTTEQLDEYLSLARMYRGDSYHHYTRLINGDEGFTPPGLLMGLMYAWYLENRIATHIEYKMTVMKIPPTDLIPEQKKMVGRREKIISFFRDVVFT
jgi:uncharacterized cofD-like protein